MTIEEIGTILRAAIRKAREGGVRIQPFDLGSREERRCCALGSLVLDDPRDEHRFSRAAHRLGLNNEQVCDLAYEFDGHQRTPKVQEDLYTLGSQLRSEVDAGAL